MIFFPSLIYHITILPASYWIPHLLKCTFAANLYTSFCIFCAILFFFSCLNNSNVSLVCGSLHASADYYYLIMVSVCVDSLLGDRCMHHLQEDSDPYFTYIIILFSFLPPCCWLLF
ncbi:uncharacterized protein BO87DRAFT_8154 [Aspergillus neoniger CBS 115656]|uniref:Uncharacterized protein n=1 Tax=Aspergillus neoniger (strain CBS 115656) TaxID=1448310 RepID=A0A318ZWE6_ASPNB|nr:hypothetical protein BO87DRAFT_8154 [Aspergillus neoniger CBS 115656]PYH39862.1 hypothetical protein BO87DRAFT_8154 [Aspergillus neoniger CBS 115656]